MTPAPALTLSPAAPTSSAGSSTTARAATLHAAPVDATVNHPVTTVATTEASAITATASGDLYVASGVTSGVQLLRGGALTPVLAADPNGEDWRGLGATSGGTLTLEGFYSTHRIAANGTDVPVQACDPSESPNGVAVAGDGTAYVITNGDICVIDSSGQQVFDTDLSAGGVNGYAGAAFDADGNLYSLGWTYSNGTCQAGTSVTVSLLELTVTGQKRLITANVLGQGVTACLQEPWQLSLILDNAGNVFFVDGDNYVRERASDGTLSTVAGTGAAPSPDSGANNGDGGPATAAAIAPVQVALSPAGDLLFSDGRNADGGDARSGGRVRQITGLAPSGGAFPQHGPLVRLNQAWPISGFGPMEYPGVPNEAEECSCGHGAFGDADSVDTATGSYSRSFTDLQLPGRGPALSLERTYSTVYASQDGLFGHGWNTPYGMTLSADSITGGLTVTQENGAAVAFQQSDTGWTPLRPRQLASLTANNDGTFTFTRRSNEVFVFSATGRLQSIKDLHGYTTTLGYSSGGALTSVTDPAGRAWAVTTTNGRITSVSDPAGRTVTYTYGATGDLASAADATGATWSYTYDSAHRLLTALDPRQQNSAHPTPLTNTYDSSGRLSSQSDAAGAVTTFDFSGLPASSKVTDPIGVVTVDTYSGGLRSTTTVGAGTSVAATTTFDYDSTLQAPTTVTDPDGNATTYTYDAAGDTLSSTDAVDRTTRNTFDVLGDVLTSTDPSGVTTTSTYTSAGDLLSTSVPVSTPATPGHAASTSTRTTSNTYGDNAHPGDLTAHTDALSTTTRYTYDADGDLTSTTDPLGNKTTSTWDGVGEKLTSTSPRGNLPGAAGGSFTTTFTYDADGRLLTLTDPNGHLTRTAYDADGNATSVTDPDAHVTTTAYDALGRAAATTRADGTTQTSTYDGDGRTTATTNGAGKTTRYAYDALGHLLTRTDPLNRVTTATWDAAGHQLSSTDASGATATNTFDAAGQLLTVTYSGTSGQSSSPAPAHAVSYAYDADGRRTTMGDATGTSTWTYDSAGDLVSFTDGAGATTVYTYDAGGRQTSMTYPRSTGTVTRSFDGDGQVISLTDPLGKVFTFTYDADGHLTSTVDPNTVTATYAWDPAGQNTSVTHTRGTGAGASTLGSFANTLDPDGLVTATATTGTAQTNQSYGYDVLKHLASVSGTAAGGTKASLAYNAADDPTTLQSGATLTYDAADEATSLTPSPGATSIAFGYDGVGRRTQAAAGTGPASTYTWDRAGNLSALTAPAGSPGATTGLNGNAAYTYDGDGLRQSTTTTAAGSSSTSTVLVKDTFARTVSSGWGKADTGGTWTGVGSDYAVTNGAATMTPAAGISDSTHLTSTYANTDATITASLNQAPTGGGVYVSLLGRRVGSNGDYRAKVNIRPSGSILFIEDTNSSGTETTIKSLTLPNLTVTAGQQLTVRVQVTGTSPTTVKAKTWLAGTSEPDWQVSGTDTTSVLQASGQVGVLDYLSGSATTTPTTSFTNLTVTDPTSSTTPSTSTTTTATSTFTWDHSSDLPLLLADGTNTYLYGPGDTPLEQITAAGTATYLSSDPLGSTRLLTDTSGTVTGTYAYTPYGTATHTGTATSPLQYTGQYTDPTGLIYLRARYYDSSTAQFLSVDPISNKTKEPYVYANDDPLDQVDLTGLMSSTTCISAAAGVLFGLSGEVCPVVLAYDSRGRRFSIGSAATSGGGAYSPQLGFSIVKQYSSARTVNQLGGWFTGVGGSFKAGVGVTGSGFWGAARGAPGGHVAGGEVGIGGGEPEIHGGPTYTWTKTYVDISIPKTVKKIFRR